MLPFHPYADLLPLIEGAEFAELVADVKANDVRDKIVVWDGAILDGRNRYRAAIEAGLIEPDDGPDRQKYFTRFVPAVDGDPLAFVISKNLKRRHLDESQRAMVAARLANMRQGERTDIKAAAPSANLPKVDQPTAAKTLSISERALRSARKVQEHGAPELVRAVDRGRLAVSVAEKATKLAPEVQRKIAAEAEAGNANAARSVVKKETRNDREAELAAKQRDLPAERVGLIYCDIPRHFNVRSDDTGMDRSPENHYPTMTFQQLIDLDVPSIAADDCILIFWSTAASLIDDIEIMAEWGFVTLRPREAGKLRRDFLVEGRWCVAEKPPGGAQAYRSMQVWDKVKIGLGYWFRDRHEFILVGVRGNPVPPAPGTQDHSLFSEEKGEHSAKPDRVAEMIERLWPNIPKLELFARKARDPKKHWKTWGNQAPDAMSTNPTTRVVEKIDTPPPVEEPPANEPGDAGNVAQPLPESNIEDPQAFDEMEIPAFLRRRDDNSLPVVPVESPPRQANQVSGEGG